MATPDAHDTPLAPEHTPTQPAQSARPVYAPRRPELHVTAEAGIVGAPAGAIYAHGTWHIFHQYRASVDRSARWAHQVSFRHAYDWDVCTDVLAAATHATTDNVWAGSAVPKGAGAWLYYTTTTGWPDNTATTIQRASIEDLQATVEHLDEDATAVDPLVVHHGSVLDDIAGYTRLRSPCVLPPLDGRYRMLVCADDAATGQPELILCESTDGHSFHPQGPIVFAGDTGIQPGARLVSPRMIRLRDDVTGTLHDVFITTIELPADDAAGTPARDVTGYLVGRCEGTTFTVATGFTPIDYGHDFVRPRNTNVADDTTFDQAVLFGLMNGAGRFDDGSSHPSLSDEGWANCLSIPRLATLQDGILYQTPTPGLRDAIVTSSRASAWTGIIDTTRGHLRLEIANEAGDVAAIVTHDGDTLTLDRSFGDFAGSTPATAPLIVADSDTLTVIVDGSTVEVFADGGVVAMASRIDFRGTPEFTVTTHGGAEILHSEVLRPGLPPLM
ncbi:GH32 C-terminal domain-containing protein [Corynebacterium sp. 13CS0277]|uniref:GH32 C-terminal domain-containing protein n=1 Tax=Corynebacterium sp. 13CS0277 TaxID=2071994 RepID=UPI00130482EE|nr:GH32 C-terminal domain-containing protein [Corynebacterium sp. 13CS0277]